MRTTVLIEGPFESDYSLAIVNRNLAYGLLDVGCPISLHQRDNTTAYPPSPDFLRAHPDLAPHFLPGTAGVHSEIHTRYIYPPYCDQMRGSVRAIHCYGWEESSFPRRYANSFNSELDLITVMSRYVARVLRDNGVTIPIEVVGLGVDHVLKAPAIPVAFLKPDLFNFVHVSSCFPRKGVDVLVDAFCQEFKRGDDVCLVLKTFPNPHNNAEELVREADKRYPGHARIEVIDASLSVGEMRFLIENANCLAAPSRGEGFGLPVGEAMLLACPVIATMHGGHADLCTPERCWPVEFQIHSALTHLSEGESYWAEPSRESLREQMRNVRNASPAELNARTAPAKAHVAANFTWARVAQRHLNACKALSSRAQPKREKQTHSSRLHVGFISTWNTKCGIAEYTRYLAESLDTGDVQYSVFAAQAEDTVRPDGENVFRCWSPQSGPAQDHGPAEVLVRKIAGRGVDLASLQYNFGFFPPAEVEYVIDQLHVAGIPVFVTLHSTNHENFPRLVSALQGADLTIVHRDEDLAKVRAHGLDRAELQRQGICVPRHGSRRPAAPPSHALAFTIACFGFFLPPKGIYEMLQAFEAAARVNPILRLNLINALYPNADSAAYAASCIHYARERGLAERIEICTDFLDEAEILRKLSRADLIVLPYTTSTESSSAAIRLPLASQSPILCSDLPLFNEFQEVLHRYPAYDTVALANRFIDLSNDRRKLQMFRKRQKELVTELSWKRVAQRFEALISRHGQMRPRGDSILEKDQGARSLQT